MHWAWLALLGYFFNAVAALFDKYLLSHRIPAPAAYAFFVAIFSLFSLFFIPFGFEFPAVKEGGLLLASGMLFVYGLVAFYQSVKHNEISRVAPLLGAVISLVAFLEFLSPASFHEVQFGVFFVLALCLLVGGGLLLSFDLPLRKGEHFSKKVLLAGLLMGLSYILLKKGFTGENFVTGIVWSRLGMFFGGISLFFIPIFRGEILGQLKHFSFKPKKATGTTFLFITNKICAGIGAFLIAYATYLGSLSFVQALGGFQYAFILVMALPLAWYYPDIYDEKQKFWDWFQKAIAILLIALGLWMATMSGIQFLS